MNRIPYSYNVLELNSEPAHFFSWKTNLIWDVNKKLKNSIKLIFILFETNWYVNTLPYIPQSKISGPVDDYSAVPNCPSLKSLEAYCLLYWVLYTFEYEELMNIHKQRHHIPRNIHTWCTCNFICSLKSLQYFYLPERKRVKILNKKRKNVKINSMKVTKAAKSN